MPRSTPPYVETWRDRHGHLRVYFRRGKGPRTKLPDEIGSEAFNVAYAACLAGEPVPGMRQKRHSAKPGTIDALIISYMHSTAFRSLRQTSRAGYMSRLEAIRVAHGQRTVSGLTRPRIMKILEPLADRPGAALDTLKKLRILVRHAIALGWLRYDPTLGIKRPKTNEISAWKESEIAAFEKRWPMGTKQRLGFALMLYTGQRRSDVHRMTWADISRGFVEVVQQKTGRKLRIPIHADLQKVLGVAPREHVTILNTEFGKSFTVDGFSQWMRDAIRAAGLPLECQPHGLRKAAGRRLAEAGCTAHEIMAVLGHSTLAEAERYTRAADQARLASSAFEKLQGQRENNKPQPNPERVGKSPAKRGEIK